MTLLNFNSLVILAKNTCFKLYKELSSKLQHSLFKRPYLPHRSINLILILTAPEGYKILGYLLHIIQVDYVTVVGLSKRFFIENGFPMLHWVVGFDFTVRQIQHGFSVLNGNVYNFVWVHSANILVARCHVYTGIGVAVFTINHRDKNALATVICYWIMY